MLEVLTTLVSHILKHPIVQDPLPDRSFFTDHHTYRLFIQFHRTLFTLGQTTLRLRRGSTLLQFVPGSTGSPGRYRIDPTAQFPPHTSDFLFDSTDPPTPPPTPLSSSSPSHRPFPTNIRQRSRSRDRQPAIHSHTAAARLPPDADAAPPATGRSGNFHH